MAFLTGTKHITNLLRDIGGRSTPVLPKKVWGTKGFEFWTFLSLLLHGSGCTRLLELGSGRSTVTLAEYARYKRAELVSLETSLEWLEKWKLELRYLRLSLPENPVRLVQQDQATGWYQLPAFRAAIGDGSLFDFVLIDAPNRADGGSSGIRDAKIAIEELRGCTENADIVIIDDVHRRHVFDTIEPTLGSPEHYEARFYDYSVGLPHPNSLFIGTRKNSAASRIVPGIEQLMGIRLYASLGRDMCPED